MRRLVSLCSHSRISGQHPRSSVFHLMTARSVGRSVGPSCRRADTISLVANKQSANIWWRRIDVDVSTPASGHERRGKRLHRHQRRCYCYCCCRSINRSVVRVDAHRQAEFTHQETRRLVSIYRCVILSISLLRFRNENNYIETLQYDWQPEELPPVGSSAVDSIQFCAVLFTAICAPHRQRHLRCTCEWYPSTGRAAGWRLSSGPWWQFSRLTITSLSPVYML